LLCLLQLRDTAERSREGLSRDDVSGGEYPSCLFFLWLLGFSRNISSLAWLKPQYIEGCGRSPFLSLLQLGEEFSISLSWQFLCRWAPPTPQETMRLLAVCQDIAKLWTIVTMFQSILGSVCLYFDDYVAKIGNLKMF
jgi:hypothetical protein